MPPQLSVETGIPPLCQVCQVLLKSQEASAGLIALAQCPRCGETFGRHSVAWLPAEQDTTFLFDQAVERLKFEGYSFDEASDLLQEYFSRFTNREYCAKAGVPPQDADSFHHDGPAGVALRAHYCIRLGLPPDYSSFVEWRTEIQRRAR